MSLGFAIIGIGADFELPGCAAFDYAVPFRS